MVWTKATVLWANWVAVLHRMGFDEVYDTAFAADLTIMEESKEFLERLGQGDKLPLFTSCCPAWVKFLCDQYPEYKDNLSTCRSPQGMFSAVMKEYYRGYEKNQGKKTFVVSHHALYGQENGDPPSKQLYQRRTGY